MMRSNPLIGLGSIGNGPNNYPANNFNSLRPSRQSSPSKYFETARASPARMTRTTPGKNGLHSGFVWWKMGKIQEENNNILLMQSVLRKGFQWSPLTYRHWVKTGNIRLLNWFSKSLKTVHCLYMLIYGRTPASPSPEIIGPESIQLHPCNFQLPRSLVRYPISVFWKPDPKKPQHGDL